MSTISTALTHGVTIGNSGPYTYGSQLTITATGAVDASAGDAVATADTYANPAIVSGTLLQVTDDLSNELAATESTTGSDTLTVNATDGFVQQTVSLSVNGALVITVPVNVTPDVSKPLAINGVGLAESGDTTNESFFMTLADTNGLLSVTSNPLGAVIGGSGSKTLTITGSLGQVNAAVANLSDTDGTFASDTITVNATDSVGNAAVEQSIAVSVLNGPVIAVPSAQLIGINKAATIAGVSLSEAGASDTDPFTATLADAQGDLSVTAFGAAFVGGSGTNSLTINGTLTDVNATLATLSDTDGTAGSDPITVNASDQFGFTAGTQTVGVTVTGLPVISAPGSAVVRVGKVTAIGGVSVTEPDQSGTETPSVTLDDTNGLLSIGAAFGATVGGNDSKTLTVSGTFTEVDNALIFLAAADSVGSTDTITVNATDQFGNTANAASIAVTVNGLPIIAVPGPVSAGVGKAIEIPGVSLFEFGVTSGETFWVTLADTHGDLSAITSGAQVLGSGTNSLTIEGSLSQVTTALSSLNDTDNVVAADTITVNATDSFDNSATAKTISVAVANGPVLAAPSVATVGIGQSSAITGVSLSEAGAVAGETFTATLADASGFLSATASGAAVLGNNGTTDLSVSGTLTDMNNTLATLHDTDSSLSTDTITVNATDGFDNTAGAKTITVTVIACFCAGTLILTETGEVPVEDLAIGDRVMTRSRAAKPIRWIGRRVVAARFADPLHALPVRIKQGALDDGVPCRDLCLSPDHALLVDGALIQAGALVNGSSIVRQTNVPEIFTYYHIELADHDLISAENTPAETFVDNVDRMGFDNWDEHQALYGETDIIIEMAYPRAKAHRQVPMATRARFAARAARLYPAAAEAA